jgi:hypothetical protein
MVDPNEFIGEGFAYKGIGRGDKNNHFMYSVLRRLRWIMIKE